MFVRECILTYYYGAGIADRDQISMQTFILNFDRAQVSLKLKFYLIFVRKVF